MLNGDSSLRYKYKCKASLDDGMAWVCIAYAPSPDLVGSHRLTD